MRSLAFAFAVLAILVATPLHASCAKPEPPSCAQQAEPFADVEEFDRCRMQMLAYRDGIDVFATCLQSEGQSANEQSARDEFQDILSRFNRRARG